MAKPTHYTPAISRSLVAALYRQAKQERIPMTKLVDRLLKTSLCGTPGWEKAKQDWPELAEYSRQDQPEG